MAARTDEEFFKDCYPDVPRTPFNMLLAKVFDVGYSWSEYRMWPDDNEAVADLRDAYEFRACAREREAQSDG